MEALSSLRFFRASEYDSAGVNRASKLPYLRWLALRLGVACPFFGVYALDG